MLTGVDVSNHQGKVDWAAVAAAGRAFAFAKASEGATFTDPCFAANWEGIRAAGMTRGAYHFARPSRNPPEVEAGFFVAALDTAGGLRPGDLLALDLEDPDVPAGADLLDWTLRWLLAVEQLAGVRPILYSGAWYLGPHQLVGQPELAEYPLWLAAYQQSEPPVPAPWTALAFWQYSSTEAVPGVSGACDADRFFGDVAALRALGLPGAAASLASGRPAGALSTDATAIREQLDRLWHVAGLLDSISAHDLAGVVREAVITIKRAVGIP